MTQPVLSIERLQVSYSTRTGSVRAAQAFEALRGLREREHSVEGEATWRYLVLAPHIEASKGLLGAQKAQVLQLFDHEEITGLELGDEQLPVDTLQNRPWLHEGTVATHDANIVVNGDADMVIQLEASASRGRVACAGAIEEAAIGDAIVRTVDGGKEAFRLRRRKYGF